LAELPIAHAQPQTENWLKLDVLEDVGQEVVGPDRTFATALAFVTLTAKDLRRARSLAGELLRNPPRVVETNSAQPSDPARH
jgi:hypothetical protein